jgi:hypothetical protein
MPIEGTDAEGLLNDQLKRDKDVLRNKLTEWRTDLHTAINAPSAPAQRGKRRRSARREQALQQPVFENAFPTVYRVLHGVERLLDLDIIRIEEINDILQTVEDELNKVTERGQTPQDKLAYIRVIRILAKIKKINLDAALRFVFEDNTPPLPPMREF